MTAEQTQSNSPSFEEAYQKLEELVSALEDGSIPLRRMVDDYEQATKLLRICQDHLKDAETRIEVLRENGGRRTAKPLDEELPF